MITLDPDPIKRASTACPKQVLRADDVDGYVRRRGLAVPSVHSSAARRSRVRGHEAGPESKTSRLQLAALYSAEGHATLRITPTSKHGSLQASGVPGRAPAHSSRARPDHRDQPQHPDGASEWIGRKSRATDHRGPAHRNFKRRRKARRPGRDLPGWDICGSKIVAAVPIRTASPLPPRLLWP